MSRRRVSDRSLTNSRIYKRNGSYKYFSPHPILNPKTGIVAKWHTLCKVCEGELKARTLLAELFDSTMAKGHGDFCARFGDWRKELYTDRAMEAPHDPVRKRIRDNGSKALGYTLNVIENAFANFNLDQITPADIAVFLSQWRGRRAAQDYKAKLSKFFAWCCEFGFMDANPAREIRVKQPKKRETYFETTDYVAIRTLLEAGDHNQQMAALYMDLLYLFYQRGTDVRLLRRDQVTGETIAFKPTKTEKSSGARVLVPIGADAKAVLEKAMSIAKLRSVYVLHDELGQPFDARKIGDIFRAACRKAGITGVTLKDIRSKAATDAGDMGYSEEQLKTALAHTDSATTRVYLRGRKVPVSEVILKVPKA